MKLPMKIKDPSREQVAARDDMIAALRKHQHLRPDEILAVAAYTVGHLVALQDQRIMTPDMAMQLVAANIEAGNQQAMKDVLSAGGSAN